MTRRRRASRVRQPDARHQASGGPSPGRSHCHRRTRQQLCARGVRPRRRGDRASRLRARVLGSGVRAEPVLRGRAGHARERLHARLGGPIGGGARRACAADTAACTCCRCCRSEEVARTPKLFVGYSDTTSLLSWLTCQCGIPALHGPMIDGRLARGSAGYDEGSFVALLQGGTGLQLTPDGVIVLRAGRRGGTDVRWHAHAADRLARDAVTRSILRRGVCCSSRTSTSGRIGSTAC